MAVIRLCLIWGSSSPHSGVTYHDHVWKFLAALSKYTWRRPAHQVAFTHQHMYTSMQTGSQTAAPKNPPALTLPMQVCTHVDTETTFKSPAQLVGANRAAHTLRLSFTHAHGFYKPSVPHFPAGPFKPQLPHVEQVDDNTHTHSHWLSFFALLPLTFHAPPFNDHRYVKKLCHLKQQPPFAT